MLELDESANAKFLGMSTHLAATAQNLSDRLALSSDILCIATPTRSVPGGRVGIIPGSYLKAPLGGAADVALY